MAWTDEMVEDLRKMWREGMTTGEIGKRLGVSKNSIVGKVHRLGLSGRPSPIKKKDTNIEDLTEAKPIKEEKTTKKLKTDRPAKSEKEIAHEAELIQTRSDERMETIRSRATKVEGPKKNHKTTLTDLDNHTCRWPIGDPKDEGFHFCGKKIKIGQTYCEEHSAIAYVKTSKK